MQKLDLKIGNQLSGSFRKGPLNFLLVFQINCPGCFFYAIPMVNQLYEKFSERVSFLGLSTAFEDFNFNNEANTAALLETGKMVGATKAALSHYGHDNYPEKFHFPVAMDQMISQKEWQEHSADMPAYVRQHLQLLPTIGLTFWNNALRGTPSMILFDEDEEVLEQWFGHWSIEKIEMTIEAYVGRL